VKGYNHDLHNTPYSRGQQAKRSPGVVIHALMTSQIIDVILGEQKLLWWVPEGWEILWVNFWSMTGAVIIFVGNSGKKRSRSGGGASSPIRIMVAIAFSLALLFICCWGLLVNSIWITAIAPAFGLMLAAIIALGYSSFQDDRLRY
ncbi:MAG: CHASE2 domain-containing protein, partial [Waterburya sp.]